MTGVTVTYFLVVADQERARDWYVRVFDAEVARERDPVIVRLFGATIILNAGGGPTPDKPEVHLAPPDDPARTSAFLNLRVDNIVDVHHRWSERGARFLTEPIDRGPEIRAFLRDPDGHLIEVGQAKQRP